MPTECNSCAARNSSGRGGEEGSSEGETITNGKDGEVVVKSGRERKGKGNVSKSIEMSHTPAMRLAVGLGGLRIQSPSSTSSGPDPSKKGKRSFKKQLKELNGGIEEEKVWKQLRSRHVGGF